MADEKTGADSVRLYLTGADAHAAYRQSHNGSLGLYRSSCRVADISFYRIQAIRNVRIEHAAGYNGPGLGYIIVTGDDSLAWAAPGESQGDAVTILNGETKVLCSETASKYIIVTRTTSAVFAGAETVQLLYTANNVVGGSNFSTADVAAQTEKARAMMFVNDGTENITSLTVTFGTGSTTTYYRATMAKETPSSNALTDKTGDGEESIPSGLTWNTTISIGTLTPGQEIGLWLVHYPVSDLPAPVPYWLTQVNWSFVRNGTTYYGRASGVCRIALDSFARYEVYRDDDADPGITGTPWQTFTTSPLEAAPNNPAVGGASAYHFVTVKRNKYGLQSVDPRFYRWNTVALGELPSAPSYVNVLPRGSGTALIQAYYLPQQDGDHSATYWRIYVSADGTDPDPSTDTPITQAMNSYGVTQTLQYTTTTGVLEDSPIKVLVRTAWKVGSTYYESANTTPATTCYAEWFGPVRPEGLLTFNRALGHHEDMDIAGPADTITYVDEDKNIYFKQGEGYLQFWADTVLLFNIKYDGTTLDTNGLYTTYALKQATVSGTAASTIEVAEWDTQKTIYIGVNGTRRVKIDVTAGELTIGPMKQGAANVSETRSDDPYWAKYLHTCFQVWDKAYMRYVTVLSVASDQSFGMLVPFRQKATQAECL